MPGPRHLWGPTALAAGRHGDYTPWQIRYPGGIMSISTKARSKALRLLAVGGIVAATAMPGVAFAQDVGTYGNGNNNNGGQGTEGSGAGGGSGGGGSLPFTGGDVAGLVIIGAGAVAGGAILTRSGRRAARA